MVQVLRMSTLDFAARGTVLLIIFVYLTYIAISPAAYHPTPIFPSRKPTQKKHQKSTNRIDNCDTKPLLYSEKRTLRKDGVFKDVETFLLFIGYPRSGSTLTGSILDAHPNIVIANEYNLFARWLNYTKLQKTKEYIFSALWSNSVLQSTRMQRAQGKKNFFSYHVPGAWQGNLSKRIKVIGDKKARCTTLLFQDPNIDFSQLKSAIGDIPVKFIHVVRNPFDNIATMLLRAAKLRQHVDEVVENVQLNNTANLHLQIYLYFQMVDKNVILRQKYGKDVLDVNYSSFIRQPREWLKTICNFLEVFCSEDYLQKCIKIIFPNETYTRRHIVWPDDYKQEVMDKIRHVDFLNGFSFDF